MEIHFQIIEWIARRRRLRSSWLSLAEGCRGQAVPCETLQLEFW